MIRYFLPFLSIISVWLPGVALQTLSPCTTNAQCPVTQICFNIVGNGGFCITNPKFPNATVSTTTAATSSNSACPSGYYLDQQTGSCYSAQHTEMTFDTAQMFCKSTGGFVVQPRNAIIGDAANFLFHYGNNKPNPSSYWIGLRKMNNMWLWPTVSDTTASTNPFSNSDPFSSTNPFSSSNSFSSGQFPLYTNWRPSQPDGCCGSDVTCVIANYITNNGVWDDASCTQTKAAVVCQKNVTAF